MIAGLFAAPRDVEEAPALPYLGHASISITLDRYGHLMPGNENEAASLLDAYLTRSGATNLRNPASAEATR